MKYSFKIILVSLLLIAGSLTYILYDGLMYLKSHNEVINTAPPDKQNTNYFQYKDLIRVNFPQEQEQIESPLIITGEARGYWFFEATFPITLTNWDGLIIAQGYATAQKPWMTDQYVPFTATLEFDKPDLYDRGSLILHKANASDLPEHDDAFEYMIRFK